jgi:predicted molibdopterin-dependent oxidoreductase YjgC
MSAKPETVAEDMLSVEIDGVEYKVRKGAMIIEVTDANGITVRSSGTARNCRRRMMC